MIPVRLALKDFLSYGAPEPIEFEPFNVACLSGDNGVGKSALLDAVTWAIWGCARGCEGGQNQDRLIRDGAQATSVEFTFDLGSARYRIVRRRSRAAKAELQFLVRDGEGWMNIAGETLKETDAKISAVLRMDYRTFTASAFFLQGRSDDFLARMKPDERKDVFARLLDLGTYEKLEDEARLHAREADVQRKEMAARIDDLTANEPDVAALETELDDIRRTARTIVAEAETIAHRLADARATLARLHGIAASLETEREALATERRAAAQAAEREAEGRREARDLDELLARADEVAAASSETEQVAALETEARERQERAVALERTRAELIAEIDGERRLVEERIAATDARIATLEAELAGLADAGSELRRIDASLEGTAEHVPSLQESRALLESLSVDGARLKEQIAQLGSLEQKAQRNLAVLDEGGGECPVCGTALDSKHRTKVRREIEKEIKTAAKDRDAASARLEVARKEAVRCREEIRRLETALAERDGLIAARQGLLARLERVGSIEAEVAELRLASHTDASVLRDEAFAAGPREALADVETQLVGLYDAAEHAALRGRLEELKPYAALAGRLEEAATRRARLVAEIEVSAAQVAELTGAIDERCRNIAALEGQLDGLEAAERSVATGEAALEELRLRDATVTAAEARLDERLASARRTADEIVRLRSEERAAADRHRRYRRLVEAFGRGGIPDLIIDNALPELEGEANHILGRLSDHEMSVHFVLQRDTKSGKVKETFEALVHHDGGVRDFAMFSGGEAFRVAFAVRLAMSKLLVRRSGARLETLVIDEGFGTQDPEGRERLVEAINVAREEFGKVLVITHLDDLKDQFGTQIRVTKDRDGSTLEVLGS